MPSSTNDLELYSRSNLTYSIGELGGKNRKKSLFRALNNRLSDILNNKLNDILNHRLHNILNNNFNRPLISIL